MFPFTSTASPPASLAIRKAPDVRECQCGIHTAEAASARNSARTDIWADIWAPYLSPSLVPSFTLAAHSAPLVLGESSRPWRSGTKKFGRIFGARIVFL